MSDSETPEPGAELDEGVGQIAAAAGALFDAGRNCAAAVLQATTGTRSPELLAACAGFAEGIGRQGCLCGAVAGGVMALGLEGRRELSGELVDRFRAAHGRTCCGSLSAGFDWSSDAHLANCRQLTVSAAATVARLLQDQEESFRSVSLGSGVGCNQD